MSVKSWKIQSMVLCLWKGVVQAALPRTDASLPTACTTGQPQGGAWGMGNGLVPCPLAKVGMHVVISATAIREKELFEMTVNTACGIITCAHKVHIHRKWWLRGKWPKLMWEVEWLGDEGKSVKINSHNSRGGGGKSVQLGISFCAFVSFVMSYHHWSCCYLNAATSCTVLPTPLHGHVDTQCLRKGCQAVFSCYPGYYLQGRTKVWCLGNQEWSSSSPVCVQKQRRQWWFKSAPFSCDKNAIF